MSTFSKRYNLFPIQDKYAYEAYVRLLASFWSAYELKYTDDKASYEKVKEPDASGLNAKMKRLIDCFLGFVLPADGLICENLDDNFLVEAENHEERLWFGLQSSNEQCHNITYGLIIQTLIPKIDEQKQVLEMVDNQPCHQAKIVLMEKYKSRKYDKSDRYVAFAASEGIFFCVLFNIIFWFKTKNLFKNLIAANRMINLDELSHRNFGCDRYKRCPNRDSHRALEIVKEFVEVEKKFIEFMLPEPIEDLNAESMIRYLYTVADNLLVELGESRYYHSNYAPEWLDIGLDQKVNTFEDITTTYTRFNVDDALDVDKLTGAVKKIDAIENTEDVDF